MARNDTTVRPPRIFSRRDFLRTAALGTGLLALGPLAGRIMPAAIGAPRKLKRLVVLNCFGGNDTMNMVAPVSLSAYHERRPGLAITSANGLDMGVGPRPTNDYFLHPSMPRIAALWADGDVAVVNKVGYEDANLSHFVSQDIYSLGVRGEFDDLGVPRSGWIARFADRYAPTPMGAVSIGVSRPLDLVGGSTNPVLIKSLGNFRIRGNGVSSRAHLHRIATVKEALKRHPGGGVSGEARAALDQAHDLTDQIQTAVESYESDVVYADKSPSTHLQDVARIIQGGFETRIFYGGIGGFDTHSDQGTGSGRHADLLKRLDDAIGSFAEDMKAMGTWNDVVIVVVTEFGRRNFINGSKGTDHGHAFAELVIGGGVKGGMFGPDPTEADLEENYLPYEVDFRQVYREVLDDHMGANPAPVFPEPQVKTGKLGIL